jgi:DNA polymerase-1
MTAERGPLVLVDAHGYLHRAYHALPPLNNSRGEPVGALYGFARMLLKILKQEKPARLVVCFDSPGPTFRHKAYADYKAHRKPIEDALRFQLPLARDLVEAWGLAQAILPGHEADDLIATLAHRGAQKNWPVVIVTADKDALQLVGGPVTVFNESRGVRYDPAAVEQKYGLAPGQLLDFFALTGDASDNVPGVPGVGEKTATTLLQKYKTLDGIYKHLDEIKGALREKLRDHEKDARMSRELVTLDADAPVDLDLDGARPPGVPPASLADFLRRWEFNSLLPELNVASSSTLPATPPAPAAPRPSAAPRRVRVVLTKDDLKAWVARARKADELSVDVETTGTDTVDSRLVGIALAVEPGEGWYIPVGHRGLGDPPQLPFEDVRAALKGLFADPDLPKVGQNLKFDCQILAAAGLPLSPLAFDTLVASYCLNPSRPNHGLKALALDMLGEAMTPIEQLIGTGAKQIGMDQVKVEDAAPYAAADAEVTLRLAALMKTQLKEKGLEKLFHEVEMPLVPILAGMETAGVALDVPYLEGLANEFGRAILAIEKEIHTLAGGPLNVNSPKQLAQVLFEKLKLPVVRKTKTGFSTDEETLQKLAPQHPLPERILAYRELAKLKSTYIDGLLATVKPSGRVHTRFNQAVAATGRLSSSDPNLQNIPIRTEHGRKIRRAFVPAKGCVFLSADYSQIDLRVLAHVSADPALTAAFRRGEDIHAATARDIFGLAAGAPVTEDQRRVAKSVNFGIVYGQTGFGLAQQLGLPIGQAQAYINAYLEKYGGVKKWIAAIIEEARAKGYVTTLLNRRRYLPEINATNAAVRGFAERTAMNTPIQGTSADIIKVAMRDVARLLEKKKWGTRMLLQVHDDLLFEVPQGELAEVAAPLRKAMESALTLDVPVVVDLKTGPNWAEMSKFRA